MWLCVAGWQVAVGGLLVDEVYCWLCLGGLGVGFVFLLVWVLVLLAGCGLLLCVGFVTGVCFI